MEYLSFDPERPLDLILLGRAAIDFNPAWNEQIREDFKPLKDVHHFEMYVGGSPANIAVGISHLGMHAGFIGCISDDQFGDFILDYFRRTGIDTSAMTRAKHGEKLGLTFTEMLSPQESHILMYRNMAADLALEPEDIHKETITRAKALLVSGTALAQSPSREAALKAILLAEETDTPVIFDIDYRSYNWKSRDEISLYYSIAASHAQLIMGSREEFDLMEALIQPGRTDEESSAYWFGKKAKICVIKHGMEGSSAYTKDGKKYSVRPFPVHARKGFGGGDGYGSGFLYGLYQGWDLSRCLEFGSAEASMMVSSNNSSDSLPDAEAVLAFIRREKEQYGEMVVRL